MTERERALTDAAAALPAVEVLASWFHEEYESAAPGLGYKTRKASRLPWRRVPKKNQNLMIAVAAVILGKLDGSVADAILEAEACGVLWARDKTESQRQERVAALRAGQADTVR